MSGFYFDEHVSRSIADGLIRRGIHVVMAVDVGMMGKDDDTEHLVYATEQGLVMVTFDHPFAGRTMSRSDHTGLICLPYSIRDDAGACIKLLEEFAQLYDPTRDSGQVFWLG
jgi:hypothetical protein